MPGKIILKHLLSVINIIPTPESFSLKIYRMVLTDVQHILETELMTSVSLLRWGHKVDGLYMCYTLKNHEILKIFGKTLVLGLRK